VTKGHPFWKKVYHLYPKVQVEEENPRGTSYPRFILQQRWWWL